MSIKRISQIREDFKKSKIDFSNSPDHPLSMFNEWFEMALASDKDNAISFVLSTVSSKNIPSSRLVLLRDLNENGFVFFTNYESSKSKDIESNNMVAANFFWNKLEKQVRITGKAIKISASASDSYFYSRPRESQLGAWASKQSSRINLDYKFMNKIDEYKGIFKGKKVERPLHWGGYCIHPEKIEFWQGRPSRLHDRLVFIKNEDNWKKERLSP